MMPSITDSGVLSADTLTLWLDKELHQIDIPQVQMLEWLRRAIEFLRENRNLPMIDLTLAKYSLRDKLLSKIQTARQKIRQKSFDFFIRNGRTTLSFDNGFVFSKNMYDDIPYFADYTYKFNKHYLGNKKVPPMDGKSNGEEFNCAIAIDSEPQVKFWIRNIRNHPASFRLPTSTDYFYPDFIACLNGDRILAVEYKGAHLADTADTKEKD
jgi:type III restriction enzyme